MSPDCPDCLHNRDEPQSTFAPGVVPTFSEAMLAGILTCDHCGRWQRFSALTIPLGREALAREGWTNEGERDWCPVCTREGRKRAVYFFGPAGNGESPELSPI